MRVRLLAALAAAVLAVGVLPAAAQSPDDLLGDGLPVDALGGGDGDGDAGGQQEASGGELPDGGEDARFIAIADGGAFDIRLGDDSLTVGHSRAGIQSAARGAACDEDLACALASGQALVEGNAEVATSDASVSDSAAAVDLTDLDLLEASLGTASVHADASSSTSAAAEGRVLSADLSLADGLLNGVSDGELDGQLQDLLDSLGGLDTGNGGSLGGGGLGLGLGELSSQLDPHFDNLSAGQIEDILADSGLGLASAAGAGTASTSPLQVAEQLIEANDAVQSGGSDGGGDGLLGGLTEGAQDTLEGVTGDGGSEAGLDSGTASVEEVASLIEDATGGVGGNDLPTDSNGLVQDVTEAVEDLLNDVADQPLVTVRVGPTVSHANDDGNVTTARASSQGAVVVVLPTADSTRENPRGLAAVEVGSASASVSSDRSDANAEFDPAVVRLSVANRLSDGGVEEITVEAGESECAGTEPLQLCVSVGNGNTTVDGSGAAASANAVSIRALGDPLPELSVDLAAATTSVNSAPAAADGDDDDVEPGEEEPDVEPVARELPRTGGGALVPGLLLLGAGAAGFAGLRRRRF